MKEPWVFLKLGLDFGSLITWSYIDAKLDVDEDHIASHSKKWLPKSDLVLYWCVPSWSKLGFWMITPFVSSMLSKSWVAYNLAFYWNLKYCVLVLNDLPPLFFLTTMDNKDGNFGWNISKGNYFINLKSLLTSGCVVVTLHSVIVALFTYRNVMLTC